VLVSTERQRALVDEAAAAAARAAELAGAGRPPELVAVELREAAVKLGQITGEEVGEDMLDRLFARFCIGK
jgi:tRNA modification GTPase